VKGKMRNEQKGEKEKNAFKKAIKITKRTSKGKEERR
jgi:hypothetical protein